MLARLALAGLVLAGGLLLLPIGTAQAIPTATRDGATVTVEAGAGEMNVLHPKVAYQLGCGSCTVLFGVEDTNTFDGMSNVLAGPGCTPDEGNGGALCGELDGVAVLRLLLDDQNDRALAPIGTSAADYQGGAGDDDLRGGAQSDTLDGGVGDDTLGGYGGDDRMAGGLGADRLVGADGNDTIDAGPGTDTVAAGPGSDVIQAADGTKDRIDCGTGRDRVTADKADVVRGCERVRRST